MTTGYRSWADERREKLQLLMLDILGVILTIAGIGLIVLAGMHVTKDALTDSRADGQAARTAASQRGAYSYR